MKKIKKAEDKSPPKNNQRIVGMTKTRVGESPISGRGIFAKKDIVKNEIIEICHTIVLKKKDEKMLRKTFLNDYYFKLFNGFPCIALGNGSLYNHSFYPNAICEESENNTLMIKALKRIENGEEILINYGGNPDSVPRIWFKLK